jgi:hypothetical protein
MKADRIFDENEKELAICWLMGVVLGKGKLSEQRRR